MSPENIGFSDKPVHVTPEGLEKLQTEVEKLRTGMRSEIRERLKRAMEFGDLSENAEYNDAKNDQAWCESRIQALEKTIRSAVLIDLKARKGSKVTLGSKVKVKDEYGESRYTIVGSVEANPAKGMISEESPVGKALMGHSKGDVVEAKTPGGIVKMSILIVS
jgi:transcription elongation factor GreA